MTSKKAAVEAARVKLEFACREAALKKESEQLKEHLAIEHATMKRKKSEIERECNLLEMERDLAVAKAEFQVFDDADGYTHCGSDNEECKIHNNDLLLNETRVSRTKSFVEQTLSNMDRNYHDELKPIEKINLSASAPKFIPALVASQPVEQFWNFLIKKELLLTRLCPFNDEAESFPAWKEGFCGIIKDLIATLREQLDLLIKYLGPKSRTQALSLRNANAANPGLAVSKIWDRLEERYGRPELIDAALKSKLERFQKISGPRDYSRLYELSDIVNEIECAKLDKRYAALLGQYDTSTGVNFILAKLPYNMQQKWVDRAAKYKHRYDVPFPPFSELCEFMREISSRYNDPSFVVFAPVDKPKANRQGVATVFKTKIQPERGPENICKIHGKGHPLRECRTFQHKPLKERNKFLKENQLCYRCCESNHVSKDCTHVVKCKLCNSVDHVTAMHFNKQPPTAPDAPDAQNHGGEKQFPLENKPISSMCTSLCDKGFSGRSCAKTILVKVCPANNPEKYVLTYAVHDDQSNRTLGSSALFDSLGINGNTRQFSLKSCAGVTQINARQPSGLMVQSVDNSCMFILPSVVECEIPCDKSEIPTPEVARYHPHLADLENKIPPLNSFADIGLLIGRDLPEVHHVEQQIIGPSQTPFAQKLPLGWVIIGEVCLGQFHKPNSINVYKTHVSQGTRPTILEPCTNNLVVKEVVQPYDSLGTNVFTTSNNDEKVGLSQDDYDFLAIMANGMQKDDDGHWKAPLPFKTPRIQLPNNRVQAVRRATMLEASLKKNPTKQQHMVEFMDQIFASRAAEVAPPIASETECWYLPLFGVYHPRKPDKIRGVFDSSVEFDGKSLNNSLLSGPNVTNSLLGVLLRFRRDKVAVVSDIQQMFYSFLVNEEHRDFLRFFWHEDNDVTKDLIEYRMRVHVFGNKPSPAIATYGLRKAVENADKDVKRFVERDFYVDDGLTSCPLIDETVNLIKRTQQVLADNGKIRLHKIASNIPEVMDSFQKEDLDKNLSLMDVFADELPTQASLGLTWDLGKDAFTFNLCLQSQPFTKRGVLSTINSIFDPLGFVTPAVITGRMLMREIFTTSESWDSPLPEDMRTKWDEWLNSLEDLKGLYFPRMFMDKSLSKADFLKIHVFCDASEKAICAVAYVHALYGSETHTGFMMGKSKLAPSGEPQYHV